MRTAIGDYGGALKDSRPPSSRRPVIREAVKRAKVDAKDVGACVLGNVIHTEAKDMYFSRVAALKGGLPQDSTALTVNRLCGSGMQAIVSASQMIHARRRRRRGRRRRRIHEPRRLPDADAALGRSAWPTATSST